MAWNHEIGLETWAKWKAEQKLVVVEVPSCQGFVYTESSHRLLKHFLFFVVGEVMFVLLHFTLSLCVLFKVHALHFSPTDISFCKESLTTRRMWTSTFTYTWIFVQFQIRPTGPEGGIKNLKYQFLCPYTLLSTDWHFVSFPFTLVITLFEITVAEIIQSNLDFSPLVSN